MKNTSFTLLALAGALMLAACGGSNNVRITEGTETIGNAPSGTLFTTKEASIVHVDLSGRLATIRNGNKFEDGAFLMVKDKDDGTQTGVLKALPKRATGLRTADVLEGRPDINDLVTRASDAEASRLSKIYRDAEQ
ncbi:hypothetical protein [Coraliomargarita sinensis]|uniref:hypothetical protein n=1 Tax=Coraliomargarita sinensis TaxID=2174842 RepID=UPI0011B50096|nr:hypothetical protein [Coraliomargarita sinensis]